MDDGGAAQNGADKGDGKDKGANPNSSGDAANGDGNNDGGGGDSGNSSSNSSDAPHNGEGIGESLTVTWDSFVTWITGNGVQILTAIAVGVGIYFALIYGRRSARKVLKKFDPDVNSSVSKVVASVFDHTSKFFMALTAARLVIGYTIPPDAIFNIVSTAFFIAITYQAAVWVRELIIGVIEIRRKNVDPDQAQSLKSAMTLLRLIINVVVFAVATIVILDNLGVNVSALLAGLGIGGVAMGLAAKGVFSDLFAALSILLDEPFKRGDTIYYDNTKGKVKQIGLQTTRLLGESGEEKIISNANLLDKEITNKTNREFRQVTFAFSLIYQTSPEKMERIPDLLKDIVKNAGGTFHHAGFVQFSASALDFEVEFLSAKDGEEDFRMRHEIGIEIMKCFAKEGIKFAMPVQTSFTAAPDGELIMPYPDSSSNSKSRHSDK